MSSFYRPHPPVPKAGVRESASVDVADGTARDAVTEAQKHWAGRRKAQPANVVLPFTRRWMSSIPAEYRPQTLPIRYGRIANLLAANWDNPRECTAYLSSLLHDRRGGRKGFPPEVLQDLQDLRVYYAKLHPLVVWDPEPEPKR